MSAEEEFLTAIYTLPDYDVPRLVFADWLDEHGQPERAEMIRLQCRIESSVSYTIAEEDRLYDLIENNRAAWTSHLSRRTGVDWQFRRGLPEELEIHVDIFLDPYSEWFARPRLRYLTLLGTTTAHLQAFACRTWNPNWIGLKFAEEPTPWLHDYPYDPSSGVRAIVMSPQAYPLRELRFFGYALGDGGISAICDSPYLSELLVLSVDLFSDAGQAQMRDPRLAKRFGDRLRIGSL
jgi:uncharacterized protein (TIGR02996 family)